MAFEQSVHAKAIELAKLSIEMTSAAGSGHPTSAGSLAHITTVLMYGHMRWDPSQPGHPASDRLVLSEGHAVPIVYAAGADLGIGIGKDPEALRPMTRDDALKLRDLDSEIDGHPNPIEGFPFFDAATGSLGQGLSVAAGVAAGARLDNLDKRVYCIIGDGESREGQIWEAMEFLVDYKLSAACPIFNCNEYGQSDPVSPNQSADTTEKKLKALGAEVRRIDGHDPKQVRDALAAHAKHAADPNAGAFAIVAETTKGWGTQSLLGHGHHGKAVGQDEVEKLCAELDEAARKLGAEWTEGDLTIPTIPGEAPAQPQTGQVPVFSEAIKQAGKESALEKGKWATRRAYGVALKALGHANSSIVALDGDVKNSTFSQLFHDDDELSERFFEARIAEQNMISAAAGLSAAGKVPFASTFAKFVTRAYDQFEMAINSGANIKAVGSHAGISLAADGPSQMSLPDVAWFRAWTRVTLPDGRPAMYLLQPADAYAAYALTLRMAEHDGPCYMRTHRPDVPFLYDDNTRFVLGGHEVLAEGKDLLILASGYMVHEAGKALPALEQAGIKPTLVDLYSLPFDEAAIRELAHEHNGMVLTAEDNYGGGFGSAVAEALSRDGGAFTLKQMEVTRVPKSGRTPDEVMRYCGLHADDVAATAQSMLEAASA